MIGKYIKEKRIKLNLSQKDLSDKLNISIQRLNNFENESRVPPLELLNDLSTILNFNVDNLNKKRNESFFIDINIFKEKIFKYRQEKKLTLNDLSEKLDISRQTLSKYEKGESLPNIDDFYLIADKLNILPSSLICIKKKKEKHIKFFTIISSIILLLALSISFIVKAINNNNNNSSFISSSLKESEESIELSTPIIETSSFMSNNTINLINNSLNEYNSIFKEHNKIRNYNIIFNDNNLEDIPFYNKEKIFLPLYFDNEKYIDHYLLDNKKLIGETSLPYEHDITLTPVYVTYEDYFKNLKYDVKSGRYEILDIKENCSIFIVPGSWYGLHEFEVNYINDNVKIFISNENYLTFNGLSINNIPSSFFLNSYNLEFINCDLNIEHLNLVAINQFNNYHYSSNFITYKELDLLYVSSDNIYSNFIYFMNNITYIIYDINAGKYIHNFIIYS